MGGSDINGNRLSKVRLSHRIFLYMLGILFISVLSLGFFWIQGTIGDYNMETAQLKRTFPESKKQEIKNKILEIKDYIRWIQHNSDKYLEQTLVKQVGRLEFPASETNAYGDSISKAVKDSISKSRVPVYVLNKKGEIIFSYNPFSKQVNQLSRVTNLSERNESEGVISKPGRISYYSNKILPGCTVVSSVDSDNFEKLLQIHILDSVSGLRFNGNEYVFINTMEGEALLTNGSYNKEPVSIFTSGNKSWIDLFKVQQTAAGNHRGVYHTYSWPALNSSIPVLKTSFFSYVPAWNWIIGTGFYHDDINALIAAKRQELYSELLKNLVQISFYLFISTLLCYFAVSYFSKKLGKNIVVFKVFFERTSKENTLIDKSQVTYREFRFMADAANKMVEQRMQIEKALVESETQYRHLFEQNPLPLIIYDIESLKLLKVNEAFLKHYDYSQEEALSMILTDLYPEEEKKAASELPKKLMGLSYAGEWHHLKKDGTRIAIEAYSHGIEYAGKTARIAVINDITQRKKMEETLTMNESQLRAIFNTITDIVFFLSVEPGEKYLFIAVNEMFLKATGLKKENVINKNYTEVLPPSAHELVRNKYREAIEKEQTVFWEEISDYPSGRKYGLVRVTPTYNDQGWCTHLVGSVHDITHIRETENEIRKLNAVLEKRVAERTSQLEKINKDLEAFTYSVSHDLRAPLRHINGYIELLIKRYSSQLDDKGKHYIHSISESSTQMGILIDDLLNFSRAGRAELKLDYIDMNKVFNDARTILEPETRNRTIEWKINPLPIIYGDYNMLRLVWVNLLGNALKYTRNRQVVTIEIGLTSSDGENIFFIRDNGVGFDMAYAQKLFGVFQRLHSIEHFEGTGIGLANVRQVINRHKGRTWAESEIDKGATFYFSIPVN